MPVLSIIACEMLEDELAYVLSEDHDLGQLIVVENRQSFRFVRKLNGTGMIYLTPMWASSWKQMRKESNSTSDFNESFLKKHYKSCQNQ